MRFITLVRLLAASVFLLGAVNSFAATEEDAEANQPAKALESDNSSNTSDGDALDLSRLDDLFAKLKKQTNYGAANATAVQIWTAWTDSGSDTINLLMDRALQAMQGKNTSLAEDLLNQVVVLAPDYAEGWNRRATFYFTISDFPRSISDIEVTLALEPRHFGALSGLAMILQQLDRDEEALTTWYRVLEVYPANKQAQKSVIDLEEKLSGRRT